ncbi:MAG: ribonuclease III [Sphaerochaetaceae bacterium]|nr:ribonuclease III [Sphaerochaetaceae bacterium]
MEEVLSDKAPVLSEERIRELSQFKEDCGIPLSDMSLLNLAFVHRSYGNEAGHGVGNNERLEFLGDSILGLTVAEWLFKNLPKKHEGDFSKIKSIAVSEDSLAVVAGKLHIGRYLLMGKGEERSGGRTKKALLADCVEALFAACYLQCGFEPTRTFILKYLVPQINAVVLNGYHHDFKTSLQEFVQYYWKKVPSYTLVKKTGPEHAFQFFVTVSVKDKVYGPAEGTTIKNAEQMAAKIAYDELHIAEWEEKRKADKAAR